MQDTKFWTIWSPNGGIPAVKHSALNLATDEATRLVEKHPERIFYILEATHCVKLESRPVKIDTLREPITEAA